MAGAVGGFDTIQGTQEIGNGGGSRTYLFLYPQRKYTHEFDAQLVGVLYLHMIAPILAADNQGVRCGRGYFASQPVSDA